jgi:hypothetical protein
MKQTIDEIYLNELIDEANKEFTLDRTLAKAVAIKYAKWKQENNKYSKYSKEEVKRFAFDFYYDMSRKMKVPENLVSENATNVDEWFEQFKKKQNE